MYTKNDFEQRQLVNLGYFILYLYLYLYLIGLVEKNIVLLLIYNIINRNVI